MKAIVRNTYGSPDVLELQETDKPDLTDPRSSSAPTSGKKRGGEGAHGSSRNQRDGIAHPSALRCR